MIKISDIFGRGFGVTVMYGSLTNSLYIMNISGKVDSYVEQVARKLAVYMNDVMEDQKDKVVENLLANGMDLPTYLTRFQWDMAKYPIKQSLKNLSDIIGNVAFLEFIEKISPIYSHIIIMTSRFLFYITPFFQLNKLVASKRT